MASWPMLPIVRAYFTTAQTRSCKTISTDSTRRQDDSMAKLRGGMRFPVPRHATFADQCGSRTANLSNGSAFFSIHGHAALAKQRLSGHHLDLPHCRIHVLHVVLLHGVIRFLRPESVHDHCTADRASAPPTVAAQQQSPRQHAAIGNNPMGAGGCRRVPDQQHHTSRGVVKY